MTDTFPVLSYTEGMEKEQSRRQFDLIKNETVFRGKVTEAKCRIWPFKEETKKGGHLCIQLIVSLLDAEGAETKHTIRHELLLPVPNPVLEGHKTPKTAGRLYVFMRAIDPSLAAYPKYDKESDTRIGPDGTVLDAKQFHDLRVEFDRMVVKKAIAWWNKPEELVGEMYFLKTVHNEATNGNTYVNVDEVYSEPPEGALVETEDFTE